MGEPNGTPRQASDSHDRSSASRAQRRGRTPPLRKPFEAALSLVYRNGWAARLCAGLASTARVSVLHHELALLDSTPLAERRAASGGRRLRLVFLSDIHVGPTTSPRVLDRAFELAARAQPDVLVLGGDYVFLEATHERLAELERRVAAVPAPLKFGVLGNHDLWTDFSAVERALERAGVELLTNRSRSLAPLHADVVMIGLDDPLAGAPDPALALASAGPARVRVGVCHSPDGLPLFAAARLDLLLCGHTHGGQIATPFGAPFVPSRTGRRFPHGLHEVGDLRLFVSRGVGGVSVPLRTCAPPDVGVFDLVPRTE